MKKLILLLCFVSFLTKAQNITVASGKSFTVEKTGSVTMSGNFSNSGAFTLNSDSDEFSSIIIGGSVSGNITYNRYVNPVGTNEWDLIGSPVDGLSISAFTSTNSSTLATNGSAYAIGEYNNVTDTWTNYTTSTIGSSGNFDIGKGYQMGSIGSGSGILIFTGVPVSTPQTQLIIDNDLANSGTGRIWNLVANPYPSYIYANNNANSTHNVLKANYNPLSLPPVDNLHNSYVALYGYNADGSGYTIYNHSSAATYIAPGQAFMVASDNSSPGTSISFTPAMRTVQGGDDFISGRIMNPTSSEFLLKLYQEEILIDNTRFYFDNDLTLGLDPGYDAGHFNQDASLISRLVEEDEGVGFAINAMGSEALSGVSIPLEVNQLSNVPFRISLEDSTIASDVEVQLEDRLLETLTLLNDEDFTLTAVEDLSGIGRFYLHLGNVTLGEDSFANSFASIYKGINDDYITIEGLPNSSKNNVSIYNLLGQLVANKSLNANQTKQTVSTKGFATGVYVIKLESGNVIVTKKIVIKK